MLTTLIATSAITLGIGLVVGYYLRKSIERLERGDDQDDNCWI